MPTARIRARILQSTAPLMSPAWSPDGAMAGVCIVRTPRLGRVRAEPAHRAAQSVFRRAPASTARRPGRPTARSSRSRCRAATATSISIYSISPRSSSRGSPRSGDRHRAVVLADGSRSTSPRTAPAARRCTGSRSAAPSSPKRVTFTGTYNARPRVSPDGKQLALLTLDEGAYRIGLQDLASGTLQVLSKGRQDESPSFAPNGAMVIFAGRERGQGVLQTVSIDGQTSRAQCRRGRSARARVGTVIISSYEERYDNEESRFDRGSARHRWRCSRVARARSRSSRHRRRQPTTDTSGVDDAERHRWVTPTHRRGRAGELLSKRIVYFDFDRADIRADSQTVVAAHAQYLAKNPAQKVRLEGHADERGSREYNIGLGERRGQAVRRALLLQGVAETQLVDGQLRRGASRGGGQRRAGVCAQPPRRDRVPEVTRELMRHCRVNTQRSLQCCWLSACVRRLRDLAGGRSGADPHERSRCARAAHRARDDQPEPARDGPAHRCAAGGAAHHARRSRAAAERERRAARRRRATCMATSKSASRRSRRSAAWAGTAGAPRQRAGRWQRAAQATHGSRRRAASYERPSTTLKGGDTRVPSRGSRNFVAAYPAARSPATRSTGSARLLRTKGNTENAITAFAKVTTDWPDSRKAPDAHGEARLHAVGTWAATATRASRSKTWCAVILAPRPRSSRRIG